MYNESFDIVMESLELVERQIKDLIRDFESKYLSIIRDN